MESLMGLFQQVEGEAAILVHNGVYKQTDLYSRNGYLYAKIGGGFVRLNADASTTKSAMRLDTLTWTGALAKDALGRLCDPKVAGSTLLDAPRQQLLLGNNPS
jgi:hypothetical protein